IRVVQKFRLHLPHSFFFSSYLTYVCFIAIVPFQWKKADCCGQSTLSVQLSCCSAKGSFSLFGFSSSLVMETMKPSISRCSFSANSANICALDEISSFAANCCSVAALVDCASSDA